MKKKEKAITLITLIVSVIIMLIIAGVVFHFAIGENGLFRIVDKVAKDYEQIQKEETEDLENLYSQIRVAEDSKVTLTMEQLDEYVNKKVEEKINNVKETLVSKEEYEQVKENIGKIRSGVINFGTVNASTSKSVAVSFTKPLDSDQYSVVITHTDSGKHFAYVGYRVSNKTVNGFTIAVYNNAAQTTGNFIFNYVVVPYTE